MAGGSAVVPAIVGNSLAACSSRRPCGSAGSTCSRSSIPPWRTAARLRFFVTATHTEQQIRETIEVLAEELQRIRAESEQQTASV